MSKTLDERLQDTKMVLDDVDTAIVRYAGKLPTVVEAQFTEITAFDSHVEHWKQILACKADSA